MPPLQIEEPPLLQHGVRRTVDGMAQLNRSLPVWDDDSTGLSSRYALEKRVGSGAYGEVFRATQRDTGDRVIRWPTILVRIRVSAANILFMTRRECATVFRFSMN